MIPQAMVPTEVLRATPRALQRDARSADVDFFLRVDCEYFAPECQDVAFAFCPISKSAIISSARTIAE